MKRFLTLLATAAMVASAANMTFQADFEDTAEGLAKGRTVGAAFVEDRVGIFDKGLSGKAIKIGPWKDMPTPGTTETAGRNFGYTYGVRECVSSRSGAVSFWVSPVDWDGTASTNHRMFCTFYASNGSMTLYKVLSEPSLFVHFFSGGKRSSLRLCDISKWKKSEWHNIIFCWDNGAYSAYVDGVMVSTGVYTPYQSDFSTMQIGTTKWKYEVGASLMDELRIFDAPLTAEEAKGIFNKTLNIAQARREIAIGKSTPKVDGKILPGEYAFSGTGFMTIGGIGLSEKQSRYSIAHDGKKLYLAVESPLGDNPKYVRGRSRDSELWEDEGVEWHIFVPGKGQFQFIVNPENAIYDSFDRKIAWNSATFDCTSAINGGVWTFEASIALEELACKDGKLSFNVCRAFRSPDANTCIVGVKRNRGFADKNAFINLTLLNAARPALRMDDFKLDPNHLSLNLSSDKPFDAKLVCTKGLETVFEKKSNGKAFEASSGNFLGGCSIVVTAADGDKTLYQNEFAIGDDSDKAMTLHYIYTELDTEEIILKCSSFYPDVARGTLHLAINDLDGKTVAEKDYPLKGRGMSFNLTYPGSTLPCGYYAFIGTHIAPDGSKTDVFNEDWCRPEKHNIPNYLSTDYIRRQPPWTPLALNGKTIDALIKSYEFNDGFLLSQVTANNNRLLGAPMRLELNGKAGAASKTLTFDNKGDFCFISQEANYDGITVTTQSRMDYDGLLKVKMTVTPPKGGCTLSSLKLVIPFDNNIVKYVHGNSQAGNNNGQSGLVSAKEWDQNLFTTYAFWTGNLNSGLSFVIANAKGWHCKNIAKSLQFIPEGKCRTAYINFIDTQFKLEKPRTIEFGIMASPGRPESRKVNRTIHTDCQMWWLHGGKYFDYLDPNYTKPRPAGTKAYPYNSIGTSAHCPHWNYYQKEWNCRGIGSYIEDHPVKSQKARDRAHWVFGCFNSESFMDFKLEQIINAIFNPKMDIHHLYFDLVAIHSCNSTEHGCVWTDDFGRNWASNDWEMRRVFFQLIRRALLLKDPDGLLSFHSHNQRVSMITSFCDIQVGGEDFVSEVGMRGNYYDIVNSDILRAYSVSYGLGPKCVFIPQLQRSLDFVAPGTQYDETIPKNQKATRHLLAMLMMHDIDYWYYTKEALALSKLKKDFGWDENTIFTPFWNTEGFFTIKNDPTGGKFYVTIFRREGRFLLMALNDSPSEAEAVIQLDLKRLLGKQPSSIKDFYEPSRTHSLDGDTLTLKLADREPAILWFE